MNTKASVLERHAGTQPSSSASPSQTWLQAHRASLIATALICIAVFRIVCTYHIFSQTFDEPASIAGGVEWFDRGTYQIDNTQPPLGRIAIGLPLYLAGNRLPANVDAPAPPRDPKGPGETKWIRVGDAILRGGPGYRRNLALARFGALPFFVITAVLTFLWSRRAFGETAACVAVLLFTTLPLALAHGGLATTDMAVTAMFLAGVYAFVFWLEDNSVGPSVILGWCIGLGVLAKFSTVVFLPIAAVVLFVLRWRVIRSGATTDKVNPLLPATSVVLVAVVAFVTMWAGYRFSVHISNSAERPHGGVDRLVGKSGKLHDLAYAVVEHTPVPMPDLLLGMSFQKTHAAEGQLVYFLGSVRKRGWWYFFPVVLMIKTPLGFLLLCGIGAGILALSSGGDGNWIGLSMPVIALLFILVTMTSPLDEGLRLILPIFPLLAMIAAFGAVGIWRSARFKAVGPIVVCGLVAWQFFASFAIHPDYISYFNELARLHHEPLVVDSDLDWGQDVFRLSSELKKRDIQSVSISYFGTTDLRDQDLPTWGPLKPNEHVTGWVAASQTAMKVGGGVAPYEGYEWLEKQTPVTRIGRSIFLYYIPERTP